MGLALAASLALHVTFVISIFMGVDAWGYHHYLRYRLSQRGLLPQRLSEYLEWCSDPQQVWLRGAWHYEFRHRELLDYFAL
ncbi:MAG: hypothetical protein AAFZ65_08780 [Planctomycetota bacterium]